MRTTFFALAALPLFAIAQDPIPDAAPTTTTTTEAPPPPVVDTSSAPLDVPPTTTDAIVVPETTPEAVPEAPDTTTEQPLQDTTTQVPPVQETTTELPPPVVDTTTGQPPVVDTTTEAIDNTPLPETTDLPFDTTTGQPFGQDTTTELPPPAVDTTTEAIDTGLPQTTTDLPLDTTGQPLAQDTTTQLPPAQDTTTDLPLGPDTTTQEHPVFPDPTTEIPPVDTTTQHSQPIIDTTTDAPPAETTTQQPPVQETTTAAEQPADTTQVQDSQPTTKDDNDHPITEAPVPTTAAPEATSSVSSVSSQVAALIPIINKWKDDPEALKDETNKQVEDTHDDIIAVIVSLGGKPDVGCAGKRKRGLFGAIGDIINNLACIAEDLTKVSGGITGGDIPAVTGAVSGVQAKNDELTDEENEDEDKTEEEKSEEEESTKQETTKKEESTTEAVTTTEEPTTTTEATTTATGDMVPCASDSCGSGDSCPMGAEPLSDAQMGIMATGPGDCNAVETTTTDGDLPTAPGNFGGFSVTEPTGRPESGSDEKRDLSPRVFTDDTSPNPLYVMTLNPTWVSQLGDASGHWFPYPVAGHAAAGVNGIYGCTAVIITSEKGVYLSHIWENPVFIDTAWTPTADDDFNRNAFEALRDGTPFAQSVTGLIGTDGNPGPLNAIYSPKVFVLTPLTGPNDPTGVTTRLRYQDRAQDLANNLASVLPGSGGEGYLLGYTRTNRELSLADPGYWGRAIFEVDMLQKVLVSRDDPNGNGLAVARWRLWVEDQLITVQDFWIPDVPNPPAGVQKREDNPNDQCLIGGGATGTTSSGPTSTEANAETTETGTTDAGTTTEAAEESTTTKEAETTAVDTTTGADTSAPETTTKAADETTTKEAETSNPTTATPSTLLTTTRPAPDTDTITSGTTDLATTTAPSRTYYPCGVFGGPRVATPYCQCSTTVSGKQYVATTTLVDGQCAAYTEFPSKIDPATEAPPPTDAPINEPLTQTDDGTVLAWSSYKLVYNQVYKDVTVTYSSGLGPARTIATPVPTQTAVDNDGSGQCGTSDGLSKSGLGEACDRAINEFDDDTIYTDYATRYSRSNKGILMAASFGQAACIAKFSCDDYGIGMSGKLIKEAREHAKANDNIWMCGHIQLSNSCRVVMDYCTNCKNEG
ncbi:hypothetical protein NW762_004611 [Fusarium torreyae]|uniref:Uncharacterized protein n=1 Tax=Fusarium torreyae TaxID=1237075 RepID=A0A9W8VH37_9HYPO|nr:hypothetical protein NW762_004611 [Fusarium torreyae]